MTAVLTGPTTRRARPGALIGAALLTPLLALSAVAQTTPAADTAAPAATAPAPAAAPAASGAQDHGTGHAMPAAQSPAPGTPASTAAYQAAMDKMHMGMAIAHTGNADVDFVRGMIPHHQGAIDMARIQLEHGTDPELRKMAEEIIAAQEGEIATMQAWLEKNAPDAARADAAKTESMAASSPVTGQPPEAKPAGAETPAAAPEAKPAEGGATAPQAKPAHPTAPASN